MNIRWEIIRSAAGEALGYVYRAWDASTLRTEQVFAGTDGECTSSLIELEGSSWVRSRYTEYAAGTPWEHGHETALNAVELIEEDDAIPNELEFLLLRQVIREDPDVTTSYHVIFSGDPRGRAREASIWSPEPGIWEVETDGELTSTHFTDDGEVVRSIIGSVSHVLASAHEVASELRGRVDERLLDELLGGKATH